MSPETPSGAPETAADLIAALRAYGLSRAEIARELNRSPRMIAKVERGESPGSHYLEALHELHQHGRLRNPPPRRRNAAGDIVPVRARADHEEALVVPVEPKRHRGAFAVDTTFLPHRGRIVDVAIPRSEGMGRERARQAILEAARSAAKGQAQGTRYMRFRLGLSNGRSVEVGAKGGYRVSDVLSRSRDEGDDPLVWLADQRAEQYDDLDDPNVKITHVEITVYGTQ